MFSSTDKKSEYHDSINLQNFQQWVVTQLLPGLKKPSLIIINNAPYHSKNLNKMPNSVWIKDSIKNWFNHNNIKFSKNMLKAELLQIAINNRKKKP